MSNSKNNFKSIKATEYYSRIIYSEYIFFQFYILILVLLSMGFISELIKEFSLFNLFRFIWLVYMSIDGFIYLNDTYKYLYTKNQESSYIYRRMSKKDYNFITKETRIYKSKVIDDTIYLDKFKFILGKTNFIVNLGNNIYYLANIKHEKYYRFYSSIDLEKLCDRKVIETPVNDCKVNRFESLIYSKYKYIILMVVLYFLIFT